MALFPLPTLHIDHRSGDAEILLVAGELDLCTAPQLAAELRWAQKTGADVIVDLQRVEFMDCAGLGVLLSASADSGPAGFSVTPGPRQLQRLFQLTGAAAQLDIVAPVRPALRIAA
jgi:anti-anti-sigma factor